MAVIYIDDFNRKHYIVVKNISELNFLKERFSHVIIL